VLVAAKYAACSTSFPHPRPLGGKKLTTRALEELSGGNIGFEVVPRRRPPRAERAGGRRPPRRLTCARSPAAASSSASRGDRQLQGGVGRPPPRAARREVDVVMTRAATEFVGPVTVEALTGRRVYTELIAPGHALDHIRLARAAELVVVAPATADFLARAVHGHADDLLSACLLATSAPVLLVPAMNDRMWAHPQVARNVAHAREIGYRVLEPADGPLAAGEGSGPGRMPEPETIVAHAGRWLEAAGPLAGRRVVVTAGPTREPVDPVRYLTNHSSGKMGVALAAAAWRRGAEVTLVAGPLQVAAPHGARVVHVETTAEMQQAVAAALPEADVLVMAAAPADFRPAAVAGEKLKRRDGALDARSRADAPTSSPRRGARDVAGP
jgi:phosphopantothenoylcysteine decarboxylase/phosphopantothenate--cysteine ligase